MKNNKKVHKTSQHQAQPKNIGFAKDSYDFASSKSFVTAVTRIYIQEIKDIDRFVRFAESHSLTLKSK